MTLQIDTERRIEDCCVYKVTRPDGISYSLMRAPEQWRIWLTEKPFDQGLSDKLIPSFQGALDFISR